jgi:hypothetical protein
MQGDLEVNATSLGIDRGHAQNRSEKGVAHTVQRFDQLEHQAMQLAI